MTLLSDLFGTLQRKSKLLVMNDIVFIVLSSYLLPFKSQSIVEKVYSVQLKVHFIRIICNLLQMFTLLMFSSTFVSSAV